MVKRGGFLLLVVCLLFVTGEGQNLIWKDTMLLVKIKNPVDPLISLVALRITQDLDYSITFSNMLFLNWQRGNGNNQVSLFQYFKYRSKLSDLNNLTISTAFVHKLGIQFFFDSIFRFQPDENTLDTRIEYKLWKTLTLSFLANITTRLFNAYDYAYDQNSTLLKTRHSSFLTPLLCTFSAGIGYSIPRFGTFTLGMSSAKITWIRNTTVYEEQGINVFYGVPKEKRYLFEYGLSFHLLIDKNFLKRFQWNCDVLIFKNFNKTVDLNMKNLIGIRINKFLKTSLQTNLFYEVETSKNIQIENILSIGFYFTL